MRTEVGDRVAAVTQVRAAELLGVSPSTVSRIVSDDLGGVCNLLAALGYQLAPADAVVTSQEELLMYKKMTVKYLMADIEYHQREMRR
ncbi:hypothetical protein GCM10023144_01450 [Pigmentiphaga soli]|uniref:HTH cro/C1-type domain-containing protein n=2 Tax=Pigmentiphaga soli TaxID=1007095 RepID=A0ABP8GCN2_9BURK